MTVFLDFERTTASIYMVEREEKPIRSAVPSADAGLSRRVSRASPGCRRRAFAALVLAVVLPPPRAHAEDEAERASAFIRDAGTRLGEIARRSPTPEGRRALLKPYLDRVVDMTGLARFCLGRFWNQADPAWRQRYVAQFETVILLNVLNRLNSYRDGGSRVVVARGVPVDDGYQVATTVQGGNDPAVRVTWRVSFERGEPRIVDVMAEGISLRVTLRSDFSSYLRQNDNNLDSLFEAMRRITAGSPTGASGRAPPQ